MLREGFAAGTSLVLAGTGVGAGQVEVVRAVSVKRATHARCPAHVRGEDVHVDERQIRSDHHRRPTSKYQLSREKTGNYYAPQIYNLKFFVEISTRNFNHFCDKANFFA